MSMKRRDLLSGSAAQSCHISSLVIHCRPEAMAAAMASIQAMPHAEVPESNPNGKFVVLLETEDEATVLEGISQIQNLQGVINATLVYHQIDE